MQKRHKLEFTEIQLGTDNVPIVWLHSSSAVISSHQFLFDTQTITFLFSGCQLILYIFAAAFGVTNYVFFQNTKELVGGNCPLYPRILEFHTIEVPETPETQNINEIHEFTKNVTDDAQDSATVPNTDDNEKVKREANDTETVVTEATLDGEAFFTGKFSTPIMI